MRAGRLRHTLTIYNPDRTTLNKFGQPTGDPVVVDTVRADITPFQGREYFDGRELDSVVTHRIRIRHLDGVTTKCYGVDENSVSYDFDSVINDDYRGRWITIMATERST